jgi:hypothetical protein
MPATASEIAGCEAYAGLARTSIRSGQGGQILKIYEMVADRLQMIAFFR